jgi:hypothetical protein
MQPAGVAGRSRASPIPVRVVAYDDRITPPTLTYFFVSQEARGRHCTPEEERETKIYLCPQRCSAHSSPLPPFSHPQHCLQLEVQLAPAAPIDRRQQPLRQHLSLKSTGQAFDLGL